MNVRFFALGILVASLCSGLPAQDRNTMVLNDRTRVVDDGYWIYNDVDAGLAQAKSTGKPVLVVFRCIPCEACAQLDEEIVENNQAIRKALSRFVCVRVVHANGMDLSRFQFDYDQSWAAFFLNADGTIYGRYGTRSHERESDSDVSLDGFLAAMEEALQLHDDFATVRPSLQAKLGSKVDVARPEDFPNLKDKYTSELNYGSEVAKSCIHCHQIGESMRGIYWSKNRPMPTELIFPYPHPKSLGLIIDPKSASTVERIVGDSWAAAAGFKSGDRLVTLDGQPMISTADVQWVLHRSTEGAIELPAEVERGGKIQQLVLRLPAGWKEQGDISWRSTSWSFRRMVTGGLRFAKGESANASQDRGVGLRVEHVGQFNAHAAAKRAGFKTDDVLISVDGKSSPMTESQLFAYLVRNKRPGDTIAVEVLREGERKMLKLPIQE